jgi:hypothetical protein
MLAATVVALAIRLYLLTRLRYLTGLTEYDDGVYLGGAVSLISGALPYHGFAFVQPPGILLLMAPAALLAKVSAVTNAMAATWATGWLPVLLAVVVAALIGAGYIVGAARAARGLRTGQAAQAGRTSGAAPGTLGWPGPVEWFALGTLACTVAAVLGYSAFFYHYPDFAAPWLAISAGYAAGALAGRGQNSTARRERRSRRGLLIWVAAAFIVVAGFQAWELSGLHAPDVHADVALIPPGACVVSDEISLTIAANRFTAGSGGCPDVLDSLATTLVAGNGVSVQGGAQALPRVVAGWKAVFSRADYVWFSGSSARRVPWTPELQAWFAGNFRPLRPPPGAVSEGRVYARRR